MYSPQRMKFLLFPFSFAYRLGSQIKNFFYERQILSGQKASLPVISVGNIAFGGSEKTPLAMNLIASFIEKGKKPALVTRGYRGEWEKKGGILSDGSNLFGTWKEAGDEPFMVAKNFPQAGIFVGKNRIASCMKARESGFGVAILDDGFQHRCLHRDLDIVLYNPSEKIALREHRSALKRAHIILLKRESGSKSQKKLAERFPQADIFRYSVRNKGFIRLSDQVRVSLENLKEKSLLIVCGIAQPRRFFTLLKEEGLTPGPVLKFPDHHAYPESSLRKIAERCRELKMDAVMTTEKDAVKLSDLVRKHGISVFFTKIEVEVEEGFHRRISVFSDESGL